MRCEGWRRYGGAFSFGPPVWRQCENEAIVVLTVEQEKIEELPACLECWNEARERDIKIWRAEPLRENSEPAAFSLGAVPVQLGRASDMSPAPAGYALAKEGADDSQT